MAFAGSNESGLAACMLVGSVRFLLMLAVCFFVVYALRHLQDAQMFAWLTNSSVYSCMKYRRLLGLAQRLQGEAVAPAVLTAATLSCNFEGSLPSDCFSAEAVVTGTSLHLWRHAEDMAMLGMIGTYTGYLRRSRLLEGICSTRTQDFIFDNWACHPEH